MFIFDNYSLSDGRAEFNYRFESGQVFQEVVEFQQVGDYDSEVLDKALFLAFILIGVSYYKSNPTPEVRVNQGSLDDWQAGFFSTVYREGLSQFVYENQLDVGRLARFIADGELSSDMSSTDYIGQGVLALQSGGKDSLLLATLLSEHGVEATPCYITSSGGYPELIDEIAPPAVIRRSIDRSGLQQAVASGGLNGHVPVTYIVQAIALVQSILLGKNTVLTSIGHEGEEPHAWVGDLAVNHQWSKTWAAEQMFADYVQRYVSASLIVGSPLRQYSESKIAELFADKAWVRFGHKFSSCNRANYEQGHDNTKLRWCGECPKCANSYLLFAPFVEPDELRGVFGGRDLFEIKELRDTFKGLLGVDGVIKPFECVGEVAELRWSYQTSQLRGYGSLGFEVPTSEYDRDYLFEAQPQVVSLIQ